MVLCARISQEDEIKNNHSLSWTLSLSLFKKDKQSVF